MKRTLITTIALTGAFTLAGCGSSADPTPSAPPSTAAADPTQTVSEPAKPNEMVDGIKAMDEAADVSYEDNGYDSALPAIEVHADKNSGVTFDGFDIELKAAERVPTDQVTAITDSYEGYDDLQPVRLTFTVSNNQEDVGPFQLEDPDVTAFYGDNLQPIDQYSVLLDNEDGPALDSDDPRQVAEGEDFDLTRTLWLPEDAEGEDLMAEILLNPEFFYVDYFIPGDQITDLK